MPAGATLKNCYRARKGDGEGEETFCVPQSFTFMAREGTAQNQRKLNIFLQYYSLDGLKLTCPVGMPGAGYGLDLDENLPRRLRQEQGGNNKDVFCMVKATMADARLSQPPILVYPQCFLPATQGFFNRINNTNLLMTASLDEGRCEELAELAENIEKDFPHMQRGVAYLRSLMDGDRRRQPLPRLQFVEAGPAASLGLGNLQVGQPPPPPKPHRLQVVFHHQPAR